MVLNFYGLHNIKLYNYNNKYSWFLGAQSLTGQNRGTEEGWRAAPGRSKGISVFYGGNEEHWLCEVIGLVKPGLQEVGKRDFNVKILMDGRT